MKYVQPAPAVAKASSVRSRTICGVSAASLALMSAGMAHAQVTDTGQANSNAEEAQAAADDDIILVYANKRGAQALQDVGLAITAFSGDRLEDSFARDLESISYSIPNVALDSLGPPGFANFTIRGLGSNSSIPSLEPAVGTFVDGIYLGTNAGVIQDFINLESVEVLRGPQGVLFGKNVAGGAVMMRTRRPGKDFLVRSKAAVNSFPGIMLGSSIEGGLSDNLSASVTGYYAKDGGPYYNITLDKDVGDMKTWFARAALYYDNDDFNAYLTFDHGENSGDSPIQQGVQTVDKLTDKKYVTAQNTICCTDTKWSSATLEINADVGFGDGIITSLTGWRNTDSQTITDVDSGPATAFNLDGMTDASQFSQELRYAGTFADVLDLTLGAFYFQQKLDYRERRTFGSIVTVFGGDVETESLAGFVNGDFHITEQLTLSAGARYTREKKSANIAPQAAPLGVAPSNCDAVTLSCRFTFAGSNVSTGWTPRVALQFEPTSDVMLYASWGKGLRSGGYNLRHTLANVTPQVTDDEKLTNYEIGAKTQFLDRRVTLNVAAFRNEIDSILRDTVVFVESVGFVQLNQNAGDAVVQGAEAELTFEVTDNFTVFGSVGYLDNKWDDIFLDISGDQIINQIDYNLILPRLSEWTTNVGAVARVPTGMGEFVVRGNYSYRSKAPYPDNNSRFLPAANVVDASVSWKVKDGLELSVFGKNLLQDELYTSYTAAGAFGDIAYLQNPRQFGLELKAEFGN